MVVPGIMGFGFSPESKRDLFDRASLLAGRLGSNFEQAIQLQLPLNGFPLTARPGRLYSNLDLTP
jgi:hypothetical protein